MKVIVGDGPLLASWAADRYAALLAEKPTAVLGLATGSSPLRIYDELVARASAGEISFARARGFTLDEYVGLGPEHPGSYRSVIAQDFVSRVDFAPGVVEGPDGLSDDLDRAARAYEQRIAAVGGVDLQILGIGTNGHIAFNEPGSAFDSRTRKEELATQTRADNARFFGGVLDRVPQWCLTQGIGTILEAREIILIASGSRKAEAVAQLVEGTPDPQWPATALQSHPRVTVLLDAGAASLLTDASEARTTRLAAQGSVAPAMSEA